MNAPSVVMDGNVKKLSKRYQETGGIIREDTEVDSLPEFLEKQLEEEIEDELVEELEKTLDDLKSLDEHDQDEIPQEEQEDDEEKMRSRLTADSMPFDKFLDFMEIF